MFFRKSIFFYQPLRPLHQRHEKWISGSLAKFVWFFVAFFVKTLGFLGRFFFRKNPSAFRCPATVEGLGISFQLEMTSIHEILGGWMRPRKISHPQGSPNNTSESGVMLAGCFFFGVEKWSHGESSHTPKKIEMMSSSWQFCVGDLFGRAGVTWPFDSKVVNMTNPTFGDTEVTAGSAPGSLVSWPPKLGNLMLA